MASLSPARAQWPHRLARQSARYSVRVEWVAKLGPVPQLTPALRAPAKMRAASSR
nr:hypothetical protein [Sphingobium fuliginis]